jgi:Ca2+-binding EF-hand superfamily protein
MDTRNDLALDGPYLFSMIDQHRLGYLTTRSISEWLLESVGFKLNDSESKLLLSRYDINNDYCIHLGEFRT